MYQTEIGNYGSFSALLSSPLNPKNQNLKKMKKIAGDIIILHKRTKIHNHRDTVPEIESETL